MLLYHIFSKKTSFRQKEKYLKVYARLRRNDMPPLADAIHPTGDSMPHFHADAIPCVARIPYRGKARDFMHVLRA